MKIENLKLKILLKPVVLVILLTLFAVFLRFYNLNWGAPYFFHPDERNIASSVSQLQLPSQMNPHFFAYGSLPIYTIYFTGMLVNSIQCPMSNIQCEISNVLFEEAIIISRFYSALFSVLLIPLLFVIASTLIAKRQTPTAGLLAAFLATTSIGFIQFAHFGTFEMWLTFFGVLLFWLCLQKITEKTIFLMGLVFGILVATKVSSVALLPLPIIAILLKGKFSNFGHWAIFIKNLLFFIIISASIYVISNPYVFWDTKSFQGSMKYESSVALGTLPVFYTGEFYDAIPGLFHFLFIYPFLLNPLVTILFIPAFAYTIYKGFKTKNSHFLLLAFSFLLLFFSQIFLFVKWTRYMMPTLPFVYLIVAVALTEIFKHYSSSEQRESRSNNEAMKQFNHTKGSRQARTITTLATGCLAIICSIFSLSYFITAFTRQDTRIEAKNVASRSIQPNVPILSEVYDLGIIPFNSDLHEIELFNFYDLDPDNPAVAADLQTKLKNSEYIILPSQRVLKIRINNPEKFPNGSDFYKSLITDKLDYEKIYETPCDLFCKISYLGDPVFRYEETANVFDRPTVFIFRKK